MAQWTDQEIDKRMGLVLRAGVVTAASVVIVGAAVFLARHGSERPAYAHFPGNAVELSGMRALAAQLKAGHGRAIIQLGVLLLIATPFARVAFAAYFFGRQKDWMYTIISSIVLAILCFGFVVSR